MLSPEEFRNEYSTAQLDEELPDSPIASLRDLQYLYGKLYTLGTLGSGEYAEYLTPDAADDLIDTPDSLIVVRVDVSGDEPRLARDDRGPVWVTRYTEDRVTKVAHSKYSAARGIDHSVTHQSGQDSSPEKLAGYATDRLTDWPQKDPVQDVAGSHDDGWIIQSLANLGEDDEVKNEIEDGVETALGGESTTALLTVQVKPEADGEYLWPGDLDIFNAAMRKRKLSKLVEKNDASDSSGQATDLVTGTATRTVGTAEDPQKYFLGKQRETFPGLDIEEAWRTHPIAEDAAITVMNSEPFVESCTYRTFGAKVYYLPYFFGRPEPEGAYDLYELLYRSSTEDDDKTPVETAYEERRHLSRDEDDLRFYVSAVMPHQMSRYDVFGETMNGRLLYPMQLSITHNDLTETSLFETNDGWSAPLPSHPSWDMLTGSEGRLHSVSSGWYFMQTFAERDDTDADADDPRIRALVAVLSGNSIPVGELLSEYVDRIQEDHDPADDNAFPDYRIASQFAQLSALAANELDLLGTDDPAKEPITREPTYETPSMDAYKEIPIADGGNPAAEKLESFIENTPALAPGDEGGTTDQRRGAFLLGALVGEVGSYQNYNEGRSTTLIDQYPVKSITTARIKKVTQETIEKTITYTRNEDRTITKFEHVVDRLRDTMVQTDPENWNLDTDDLRFYYGLGVTYGMNDHPDWDETDSSEEDT